jgi:hypothetical protein
MYEKPRHYRGPGEVEKGENATVQKYHYIGWELCPRIKDYCEVYR